MIVQVKHVTLAPRVSAVSALLATPSFGVTNFYTNEEPWLAIEAGVALFNTTAANVLLANEVTSLQASNAGHVSVPAQPAPQVEQNQPSTRFDLFREEVCFQALC